MVNGVDEFTTRPITKRQCVASVPIRQAFRRLGGIVVSNERKLIFPQNANFRARFRYDAVFPRRIGLRVVAVAAALAHSLFPKSPLKPL
jgi:hypothetical protein